MSKHHANAIWEGALLKGKGHFTLKTNGYQGAYSFPTRFEDNKEQSSPEELIAAAHASCFSMAFAHALDQAGFTPETIETEAEVTLGKADGGFAITGILLKMTGKVSGIEQAKFLEIATDAKNNCPVSKALKAVDISLSATLV